MVILLFPWTFFELGILRVLGWGFFFFFFLFTRSFDFFVFFFFLGVEKGIQQKG